MKKIIIKCFLVLVAVSALVLEGFCYASRNNNQNHLVSSQVDAINSKNTRNAEMTKSSSTNQNLEILDDIAKINVEDSNYRVRGIANFDEYVQYRTTDAWNNWNSPQTLRSLDHRNKINFGIKTLIGNRTIDTFNFAWEGNNVKVNGDFGSNQYTSDYDKHPQKIDGSTKTPSNIVIKEVSVPIKFTADENVKDLNGINYFIKKLSFDEINKEMLNKYNEVSTDNSRWDWYKPEINWKWNYHPVKYKFGYGITAPYGFLSGGTACNWFTEFAGLDETMKSQIDNQILGAISFKKNKIVSPTGLINFTFENLMEDNNGTIWNGSTIQQTTRNILGFNKTFWDFYGINYANKILKEVYDNIIIPSVQNYIDISQLYSPLKPLAPDGYIKWYENINHNMIFRTDAKFNKTKVLAFIGDINSLAFSNVYDLNNAYYTLLNNPEKDYKGMPVDENSYAKRIVDINGNYFVKKINNWTLDGFAKFYNALLIVFISYDIVANATVKTKNKEEQIRDEKGNVKDIVIWDSKKTNWNYDFINDIGKDYIQSNVLNFKIDTFKIIPSKNKSLSNNVEISNIGEFTYQNATDKWFSIKYRFNAIPFNLLTLKSVYETNDYRHFSVFSDYTINQLVNLNNGKIETIDNSGNKVTKEWYVNDFQISPEYNVNKIILDSLNWSLRAYVRDVEGIDYVVNGYSIFGEVISGIGIGDLNKYFDFDKKQPFFNLESWENALSTFRILVDDEYRRYPLFASSVDNNTIYCIATIPYWIYPDGTHGNFEKVYSQIYNNEFKRINDEDVFDHRFYTMTEVEPFSRIKSDGDFDNNGYFLVKMNVGSSNKSWASPNRNMNGYTITNFDDIERQYLLPPDKRSNKPWEHAGISQIINAVNPDGTTRYWVNNKKKIVEENFFNTETYYINDWDLNWDLLMEDLNIYPDTQRYKILKDNAINWIKYSKKYTKDEANKILNNTDEYDLVKQALEWYTKNSIIEIDIKNYWFSDISMLAIDPIVKALTEFYGYNWTKDLITKKEVTVLGHKTGSYEYVLNSKFFETPFNGNKFTKNLRIIKRPDNQYGIVRKDGTTQSIATIRMPNAIFRRMIKKGIIETPIYWDDIHYNPFEQEGNIFIENIKMAMIGVEGVWVNRDAPNYTRDGKLIKQDLRKELNSLNIIYITVIPISVILIIAAIFVLISMIKRK